MRGFLGMGMGRYDDFRHSFSPVGFLTIDLWFRHLFSCIGFLTIDVWFCLLFQISIHLLCTLIE